jgi:hypothetical protein
VLSLNKTRSSISAITKTDGLVIFLPGTFSPSRKQKQEFPGKQFFCTLWHNPPTSTTSPTIKRKIQMLKHNRLVHSPKNAFFNRHHDFRDLARLRKKLVRVSCRMLLFNEKNKSDDVLTDIFFARPFISYEFDMPSPTSNSIIQPFDSF